jgi:hypothetical protein
VELGVEHRDTLAFGGQDVGVGAREAFDQPVQAQPVKVVAHLVGGVGDAEQMVHLGTQAPVGESEGVQPDTQGGDQGHDPRVAEPQGRGPPAVGGDRRQRDPLKGWARKDTTLAGALSIKRS